MSLGSRIDPRLRVIFLVAVAVGLFWVRDLPLLAAAVGLLGAGWLIVGLGARRLLRQVTKLWGLAAFVIGSYALTASDDGTPDEWVRVFDLIALNASNALVGVVMVLRVLAVVMASQIARAGDTTAIAQGLRKVGVPEGAANTLDVVLRLLGEGGGGGGGGRGTGGGRNRQNDPALGGFWASVKRLSRGEVQPIVHRLVRQIDRAEQALGNKPGARDTAIIAGVALSMLGVKALKVLPSIPFAPGHKLVILTPLYVLASMLTRRRAGATLTGLTMGTVAFLMGDGKYGIFEIVKHVVPGVLCDLLVPIALRIPSALTWSILGGIIAAGRFATIFAVTALVQAPAVAYAILIPGLTVHVTFGVASGYVTHHLVRAMREIEKQRADEEYAAPLSEVENVHSGSV